MNPFLIITLITVYFAVLFSISYFTSKNSDDESFFTGNKQSPWYLVAFGMIGASLSGVTFISIPGTVAGSSFGYMQMVLGYLVGYAIIALVLMPLYYRLQLTSIYSFLEERFGRNTQLVGAGFFLLSRVVGASLRMYLVVLVLQHFVFEPMGVHYSITIFISLALIWVYTFKSGIKTIVWTDSLQTFFMLLSLGISIYVIGDSFEWSFFESINEVTKSSYSKVFFFDDILGKGHFLKQFFGGAIIAVAMTGLDQDMMQKNLTCPNIKDAQKNVLGFSVVLVLVNFLFLVLGALLFLYSDANGISIPTRMVDGVEKTATDLLFPVLAIEHLGTFCGVTFLIGLIAAAYSSADSALTALTTSFCYDFLKLDKRKGNFPKGMRNYVHIGFTGLLFIVIVLFYKSNDTSTINKLFTWAGYTYGPLLGLFFFGIISKAQPKDSLIPLVCIIAPVLSYVLDQNSVAWFGGYQFGFELLLVNGVLTYLGLGLLPKRQGFH